MRSKNKKKLWFYGLLMVNIILSVFLIIWKDGSLWDNILFSDKTDIFMDFFQSLKVTEGMMPYEKGCIYPPLTYILYAFLYHLLPVSVRKGDVTQIRASQTGMIVFFLYMILASILLAYIIYRCKQGKESEKLLFTSLFFVTTPYIYAVERGNIILLTLLALFIFVYGNDSKEKWLREVSYLSLAVATAIKIYPVFFGIVLLQKKRWKDAIHCVIYGVLVFFVPFFAFGGIGKTALLINNIFSTTDIFATVRYGYRVNFLNTWNAFNYFLKGGNNETIGKVIVAIVALLCIVCVFVEQKKWKKYALLSILMVAIPNYSCIYALMFMIIPCALFLDDAETGKGDIFYALCFVFMFAIIPVNLLNYYPITLEGWPYTLGTCMESLALVCMTIGIVAENLKKLFYRCKIAKGE